ncbi:MAG: NAD(P)-dependent oxidoreductase, partial [Planctomycetes bacterium]|nr:NAD(P)-dependent oxidoreductase [Planctomycetota bacterium]
MSGYRILVTGVCGFTGRHLVERLRHDSSAVLTGLDTLPEPTVRVNRYFCRDLTDPPAVDEAVGAAQPDVVFHLAGLMGQASADEIRRVNVGGFICLMDVLRRQASRQGRPIRLVTVGSAAEIGSSGAAKLPVTEDACCNPETPYGQSKWEVTQRVLVEPPEGLLRVVVARPFN